MCGVSGFIERSNIRDKKNITKIANGMIDSLSHRGPDDRGVWVCEEEGVAIGHTRLSIIDLSKAGQQPMVSNCGRYVLSFNGEIYNYKEIRNKLEHHGFDDWRGNSDTEVLLNAISCWGILSTLRFSNGMFAIILWDKKNKCLYLARDRVGKKPLYYGWSGNTLLFSSEIKAMYRHPEWRGELDNKAIGEYLFNGYISSPRSIYKNILKLPAAAFLKISLDIVENHQTLPYPEKYWNYNERDERNNQNKTDADWLDELEELMIDSIRIRSISDVPLGAFLSGGFDSSAIVSLMKEISSDKIKTFTVGFPQEQLNEAKYAKNISELVGTEHHEHFINERNLIDEIPKYLGIHDEPFSDASQIPMYVISEIASREVKVCLTGDGADELFGGYSRYKRATMLWSYIKLIPPPIRKIIMNLVGETGRYMNLEKWPLGKLAELASATNALDVNMLLRAQWRTTRRIGKGNYYKDELPLKFECMRDDRSITESMMCDDFLTYLPDDVLTKVDRATMAHGLEARSPFLDYRVIELANKLPMSYKLRGSKQKWIINELVYRHIPRDIMDRPKQGFRPPIKEWLRGPLKEWAGDLILQDNNYDSLFLEKKEIMRKWDDHQNGKANWMNEIWTLVVFKNWMNINN